MVADGIQPGSPKLRSFRSTIIDVAKAAKVSQGTVSNALSGRRFVEPVTKQRIEDAAARLGYIPNSRAQSLRGVRSDTIGLFLSLPMASAEVPRRFGFTMEVAAIAAARLATKGAALMLVPPTNSDLVAPRFLDVEGALFIEPASDNRVIAELLKRGTPIVSVGLASGMPNGWCIDLQSRRAAEIILEHLAEQGCRQIALVVSCHAYDLSLEAIIAYTDFQGLRDQSAIILKLDESLTEEEAIAAIAGMIAGNPEIDGVCAPYDPFAIAAFRAVQQFTKTPSRAILVATRYDSPRVREIGITAVDIHLEAAATKAVELLLDLMQGVASSTSHIMPTPNLLLRRSSVSTLT